MKKISRRSEQAHSTKDKRIRLVGTCRKVHLVQNLAFLLTAVNSLSLNRNKSKTRTIPERFLDFFTAIKCIYWAFLPEALKRYPFKAAPPCIGRYRECPLPGCYVELQTKNTQNKKAKGALGRQRVIDLYFFVILGRIFMSYKCTFNYKTI